MNKKDKKILVKGEQKHIRISPQKVRLVVAAIKNLPPQKAIDYLRFLNKSAALPLIKIIKQAMANATNNLKLNGADLKFNSIEVGPGATYKRWRPVSRGKAHSILKRTSNVKVFLEIKEEDKKVGKKEKSSKSTKTAGKTPKKNSKKGRAKETKKKPSLKKEKK